MSRDALAAVWLGAFALSVFTAILWAFAGYWMATLGWSCSASAWLILVLREGQP